jgi:tetratricopeptide (TPR) repeat protein
MLNSYYFAPPQELMPKARAAALRALEIDDNLAEAHTSLALIAETYDWDWQAAEREYRRAIAVNPAYSTAHHWWAECLMFEGRFDEAFAESDRARQLDPMSPIIAADRGAIFFFSRHYDRAIDQFRAVLETEPSFPRAYLITSAYLENGQFAEALAATDGWPGAAESPWTAALEARIFARMGQTARAQQALERLKTLDHDGTLNPALLIVSYLGTGNVNAAFQQLERAYRSHSVALIALKVDPTYDAVRRDPRFVSLLHRVGLDATPVSAR